MVLSHETLPGKSPVGLWAAPPGTPEGVTPQVLLFAVQFLWPRWRPPPAPHLLITVKCAILSRHTSSWLLVGLTSQLIPKASAYITTDAAPRLFPHPPVPRIP